MPQPARDDLRIPADTGAAARASRAASRRARAAAALRAVDLPSEAPARRGPSPRLVPAPKQRHARPVALRAVPAAAPPSPPRVTRPPSLRRPTFKAGAALAAITALAAGIGSLLGLPVPGVDSGGAARSSAALAGDPALLGLGEGTPLGLTKGPFFPVAGEIGWGEADAKFGSSRGGRRHEGQDMFGKPGTPLVSVRDGVVVDGGGQRHPYSGGRGNWVVVYSPLDDRSYVYLHLLKPPLAKLGDPVQAGQPLGRLGCSGSCWGPHLHFEVREGRAAPRAKTRPVDPLPPLRQWPQVPGLPAAGQ
jgi:murein DD-endopeptidase MepM/ murein hydrolase activator NlpD